MAVARYPEQPRLVAKRACRRLIDRNRLFKQLDPWYRDDRVPELLQLLHIQSSWDPDVVEPRGFGRDWALVEPRGFGRDWAQ